MLVVSKDSLLDRAQVKKALQSIYSPRAVFSARVSEVFVVNDGSKYNRYFQTLHPWYLGCEFRQARISSISVRQTHVSSSSQRRALASTLCGYTTFKLCINDTLPNVNFVMALLKGVASILVLQFRLSSSSQRRAFTMAQRGHAVRNVLPTDIFSSNLARAANRSST